jgi:hypothetical protein
MAGSRDLFKRSVDGTDRFFPLIRRRWVLGEKAVTDGDTTEVETDDAWLIRTKGVDHLQTSSSQVDVKTGAWAMGKTSGRESDEAAFFVSAEELDWDLQNLGGRQKKGFGVFGPAKSAGSHGNGFIWSKGPDFSLELGENG